MSITIKSGAKVLYQWERGVALTASTPCDILRISREDDSVTDDLYPVISGSTGTALIPDRMLTESGYLHVSRIDHADGSERVLETVRILVRHAAKPQNTASSTKEIDDIQAIRMQMAALERAAREGKFDGKDGTTPHIGGNGNWWLGDDDTGIAATGDDGITPHIGGNGNWYVGDVDTGVKATGDNGITPHIGANGNWYVGSVDTGVPATGADGYTPQKNVDYFDGADGYTPQKGVDYFDGKDGYTPKKGVDYFDGDDGITPHIGINGNWYIGDVDTGVLARGLLDLPSIGANGNWFIGGVDTGVAASGGGGVTQITSDMVTGALGYIPVTPQQLEATSETAAAAQKTAGEAKTLAENAQPKGDYALKSEIPDVPVQSVNGKTGAVQLAASDVGASPTGHKHSKADITDFPTTMTPTAHNQAASTITAGTFAGKVQANASAAATVTTAQVRDIYAGTDDMTAGTSSLASGTLYLVYE